MSTLRPLNVFLSSSSKKVDTRVKNEYHNNKMDREHPEKDITMGSYTLPMIFRVCGLFRDGSGRGV